MADEKNHLIWKFPIRFDESEFDIEMPEESEILHIAMQGIELPHTVIQLVNQMMDGMVISDPAPWMWVKVPADSQKKCKRHFKLLMTGEPFNSDWRYLGTFQVNNGNLVVHVLEDRRKYIVC